MNKRFYFLLLAFLLVFNHRLLAAQQNAEEIQWFFLVVSLLGGLSFFLYGMEKMSEGLKKSAGHQMRSILGRLTKNRFIALLVGAFVTMVIQSSSATTVMLISFVQAGILNFSQSIAVIIGANIGTTFTAQLIAFKLTNYALLMVVVGFVLSTFVKNANLKYIGHAVLGFGILFFGMKIMSEAMYPLRSYPAFIQVLRELENPFVSILVGAIVTALIQSSSAFTGIVIVLAQQNLITLEAGIPLIIGANIGTSVTAWLATIGANKDTKRVAVAHTLFNVGGALLFVFWIPFFVDIVIDISDVFGSGISRQIANAHSIFNVVVGLIFLPFTGLMAKLIRLIFPYTEVEEKDKHTTKYLDEKVLNTPDLALGLAKKEIVRMIDTIGTMVKGIIQPFVQKVSKNKAAELVEEINCQDSEIDFLQEAIVQYLIKAGQHTMTNEQSRESYGLISIAHDIKGISDIMVAHILPLVELRKISLSDFSKEGQEEIRVYHEKMCKQISRLSKALDSFDPEQAHHIMEKETKYENMEQMLRAQHLNRVYSAYKESVDTHQLHMEIMNLLMQVNVYAGKIADTIMQTSPKRKVQ
jgi:phosphate:Na+ symporter